MAVGYDLLGTLRARAELEKLDDRTPPVACPNDGTPLEGGPSGSLHCRHDGWTYPRDWDGSVVF